MFLKSWIPYSGDKSVRKKVRELKNKGMAITILFSLGVSKVFEKIINFEIFLLVRWLVYTVFLGVGYVYWSELDRIKEDVQQKAEDLNSE
jgi:hypothetical protein